MVQTPNLLKGEADPWAKGQILYIYIHIRDVSFIMTQGSNINIYTSLILLLKGLILKSSTMPLNPWDGLAYDLRLEDSVLQTVGTASIKVSSSDTWIIGLNSKWIIEYSNVPHAANINIVQWQNDYI